MPLYRDSDNAILIERVYDPITRNYINNATIQVTLVDSAGVEVAGASWPINASYIADSNGNYYAPIDDAVQITDGQVYTAKITITGTGATTRYIEFEVPCVLDHRSSK